MSSKKYSAPDDSLFDAAKTFEKWGNFTSLKPGRKYLVTACESKDTGYGKRHVLEMTDSVTDDTLKVWAPADFGSQLRKASVKWKLQFWMMYKGTEERRSKETETTYTGHLYRLAQLAKQKEPVKSVVSAAKAKVPITDGEESEA
jgi:hypothetical protein